MGTIQIENVSFKYDSMVNNLFDSLNLKIDESWKLGLIGRNGRGKTTLLKIIQGKLPYQGKITSNLKFYYYPQTIVDNKVPTRKIVEELSGLSEYDLWKMEIELEKLQVDVNVLQQQFQVLSPGEQTKVLLAILFLNNDGFQLLDEPTNHLDIEGRKVVSNYLKNKKGFIVISHDKSFLNPILDHVISINRNDVTVYKGNFDTWQKAMNQQTNLESSQKNQLKNDIRRLHETAVKRKSWAQKSDEQNPDSTGRKMMKKSQTIVKRVDSEITEKRSLLRNIEIEAPLKLNYVELFRPKILLEINNLELIHGVIETPPVSLKVKPNQVVALIGKNGIGKSTILRQILNVPQSFTQRGQIHLAKNLKISYLQQNNELFGSIRQLAVNKKIEPEMVYSNLRKLGFERYLFDQPVEKMSQGQRRKVALAMSLSEEANIYFWDEPLNYLDVITRQQIIEAIKKQHPTMLLIDHDQDLIESVATQKVILR